MTVFGFFVDDSSLVVDGVQFGDYGGGAVVVFLYGGGYE